MNKEEMRTPLLMILLFIVLLCTALLVHIYVNDDSENYEAIKQIIENSEWPYQEVPVLYNINVELIKKNSKTFVQQISQGVTFEEVVDYLYQLSDAGFEADDFFGSNDPHRINMNVDLKTLEGITWVGNSDKYRIVVDWKNPNVVPADTIFSVTLYLIENID